MLHSKDLQLVCTRMLSRKAYFSFELKKKLMEKGYPEDQVAKLIRKCQDSLLINDEETYRWYIHDWQHLKRKGKFLLAQTLKNKGAATEEVQEMITRYYDDQLDITTIKELIKSKIKQKLAGKELSREKIHQYLYQRGFPLELLHKELEEQT